MSLLRALEDRTIQAAAVLQGNELPDADTATFLDRALIEEAATALAAIRAQVPALDSARLDLVSYALDLVITPTLWRSLMARLTLEWDGFDSSWAAPVREGEPLTGIPVLDSLDRHYDVAYAWIYEVGGIDAPDALFTLQLDFRSFMNIPRLVGIYDSTAVPGVSFAMPVEPALGYNSAEVDRGPMGAGQWRFTFDEGRGDCPAGCTWSMRSVVDYDRATHRVTLVRRDSSEAHFRPTRRSSE